MIFKQQHVSKAKKALIKSLVVRVLNPKVNVVVAVPFFSVCKLALSYPPCIVWINVDFKTIFIKRSRSNKNKSMRLNQKLLSSDQCEVVVKFLICSSVSIILAARVVCRISWRPYSHILLLCFCIVSSVCGYCGWRCRGLLKGVATLVSWI